jgi:hypothetical protein
MRVRTEIAQVSIEGGSRYGRPRGTLVDERSSRLARGRDRGSLYVLVEVLGHTADRDIVADQLAEVIRDAYFGGRGSVTAGLQNAILQANSLLFDHNRNALPGEKQTAGISCLVLRTSPHRSADAEGDMFIAQAGPAAVFLLHEGEVTRFPEISPWLDGLPLEDSDAAALGERRDTNVALYHAQIRIHDTILLVESDLASNVPPQQWLDILNRASAEAIAETLLEASKGHGRSALVLRLHGEGAELPTPQPTEPTSAGATPQPAIGEKITSWLDQLRLGERLRVAGNALVVALSSLWGAMLTVLRRMTPGPPGPQQTRGRQTPAVKESKRIPKKKRRERARTGVENERLQKLLIGVAIAIPLIVAAIVVVTYLQRDRVQDAELETLWLEANRRWEQALQPADEATTRTLLTEAQGYLDQLLEYEPEHAEAVNLRQSIEVRLDELNHVERLSWIGELKTYTANADLSRVVVEGMHIFVMDRQAGKVYHHRLDEFQQSLQPDSLDVVLLSKGDQIENVLVSDLVDMVWMPVGNNRQTANLVILESGGALLEYDPSTAELAALNVAAAETWQYPRLVGSYYGRFYVLDPTANKIWRYSPTLDGYSNPPDDWLESEVDLLGVVDMAIGDSIYLLYADGRISKLTGGRPDTFDAGDWDSQPQNPVAFFTRPPEDTQWVYVADRGNSRIVQCDKEGKFRRQFRLADTQATGGSDPLADVTSLFVDEIGGRAYLLSGQALYVIILPN